jgi:hypothetical protein
MSDVSGRRARFEEIQASLRDGGRLGERRQFGQISVERYDRLPDVPGS